MIIGKKLLFRKGSDNTSNTGEISWVFERLMIVD
jgi:hypothetical protein